MNSFILALRDGKCRPLIFEMLISNEITKPVGLYVIVCDCSFWDSFSIMKVESVHVLCYLKFWIFLCKTYYIHILTNICNIIISILNVLIYNCDIHFYSKYFCCTVTAVKDIAIPCLSVGGEWRLRDNTVSLCTTLEKLTDGGITIKLLPFF